MTVSDAWMDFVAGWCSGAAAVLVLQPVDTVLTRLQAGGLVQPVATARVVETAAVPAAVSLWQAAGASALWRGAAPMIYSVPVQNSLLMGGYGVGQKYAEQFDPSQKNAAAFVGGCTGGIMQSFLMSPVELVKVQQQCNLNTSRATAMKELMKSAAWRRGLGATLLRDGIPHGVWFWTYEVTKEYLTTSFQSTTNANGGMTAASAASSTTSVQQQVLVPLLSGAWAATVAWSVGYPADVIKTRIQAGSGKGIIGTARELVQESGGSIKGLYKGFGLKLVRSVPASMIGFTVYEFVKKQIETNL